jgi:hypothetical protein
MNRGTIRQAIMDGVEDQTIDETILNQWIQDGDNAVQTWRPEEVGAKMTFDFWDYLKELKPYTMTAGQVKFKLPDNFRSFSKFTITGDITPYRKVDEALRDSYPDHICWIIGKYLYIQANSLPAGTIANLLFIHISDEFVSDADEPEIESVYHTAHICYGKARYYNQINETSEEEKNMAEFNKWMLRKKNDQEINRMQDNPNEAGFSQSSIA